MTFHVFVCDSENYMENCLGPNFGSQIWEVFSWKISFHLHKIIFSEPISQWFSGWSVEQSKPSVIWRTSFSSTITRPTQLSSRPCLSQESRRRPWCHFSWRITAWRSCMSRSSEQLVQGSSQAWDLAPSDQVSRVGPFCGSYIARSFLKAEIFPEWILVEKFPWKSGIFWWIFRWIFSCLFSQGKNPQKKSTKNPPRKPNTKIHQKFQGRGVIDFPLWGTQQNLVESVSSKTLKGKSAAVPGAEALLRLDRAEFAVEMELN